jgi:hypothetical protein
MKIEYTVVGEFNTYNRDFSPKVLIVNGIQEVIEANTFEKTLHCLTESNDFDIITLLRDAQVKLKGTEGLLYNKLAIRPIFKILNLEEYKESPEDFLKDKK